MVIMVDFAARTELIPLELQMQSFAIYIPIQLLVPQGEPVLMGFPSTRLRALTGEVHGRQQAQHIPGHPLPLLGMAKGR